MAKRKGKALEQLVHILERHLASPSADVESPKRMRDRITKRMREHDVVVTLRDGHHSILVALECRDRTRKVGQPDVEAFIKKCEHTGIDKGIIVSSTGFAETALIKADACGIRCLGLDDAASFPWLATSKLKYIHQLLWRLDLTIDLVDPKADEETKNFLLVDASGQEVPRAIFEQLMVNYTNSPGWRAIGPQGDFCIALVVNVENLFVKNTKTSKISPVRSVYARGQYHLTEENMPLTLKRYGDRLDGKTLTELAVGEVKVDDLKRKLVVINDPKAGGAVFLALESDGTTKSSERKGVGR